jgi:hypothetical protein
VVNAVIHRQKNGTLLKLVIGDALVTGHSLTETTACGREANIEGCLYDLIDDEGEKTSLAALRPQDFAQLLAIADAVTVYPRPESGWTNFARQGDSKEERLSMLPPFQPFLDIFTRRRGAHTAHTQLGRPTHEAPTREYTHKHTQTHSPRHTKG